MLTVQVGSGTLGFFLIKHGKPVQQTKQPWPSDKEITPQTREQGSWFFLLIHPYPCFIHRDLWTVAEYVYDCQLADDVEISVEFISLCFHLILLQGS